MNKQEIEDIAEACHEVNRVYCELIGDKSQVPWLFAPAWQKQSSINGVEYHLKHPDAKPEDSHNNWLKEKVELGWAYGEVKDIEKKIHPCIKPYSELPESQKTKDILFMSVVRASHRIIDGEE